MSKPRISVGGLKPDLRALVMQLSLSAVLAGSFMPCALADDFADGTAYQNRGEYQQALTCYNRVIAQDPKNEVAYSNRGTVYLRLKQFERAILDFDQALALAPRDALALNGRGNAFLWLNQMDRAILDYDQAIASDPSYPDPYNGRGDAHAYLKQMDLAIKDFDKSIALNPTYVNPWDGRANCYIDLKQYDRALAGLDRAIAIAPNYFPAYASRAVVYARLNKAAEFYKDIARAEALEPNNPRVQELRALGAKLHSDSSIQDKWALVIGISKFANPQYNLKYAAKDAQDFYNYLVTDAHFQKDHVLLLLDDKATKLNILNAFGDKWLPNLCQEGDLAVVYISTHGTPKTRDRGGQNYIVAYDTDATALFASGVNMDELYSQIKERIKTDRALIVMDTCYSGGGVPGAKGLARADNFNASDVAQGCGHLVITSSSPDERSWESKSQPNGIFTIHLLEALRANGAKIDVKRAFEKAKQDVEWDVKTNYGESQTPQLGGDWEGSELILSAPAMAPRPMPADAQSFVFGSPHWPAQDQSPTAQGHQNSNRYNLPAAKSKNHRVQSPA